MQLVKFLLVIVAIFSFKVSAEEFDKISLNFKNIETHKLLKIISDFSGKGLVLPDSNMGVTSIYVKNTPWNEALRAIEQSEHLTININDALIIVSKDECKKTILTTNR